MAVQENPLAELEAQLGIAPDEIAAPPKRGRGRPAGSTNAAGRTPRRPTAPNLASIKGQMLKMLDLANTGFILAAPRYQALRLQPEEMEQLADGITLEINASPKLQSFVGKAQAVSPHLALAAAIGGIALSRFAMLSQIPPAPPKPTAAPPANAMHTNGAAPIYDFQSPVPPVSTAINDAGQRVEPQGPRWAQ